MRNFRERRYALNISQKELAQRAGVGQTTLSKMESGRQRDYGTKAALLVETALSSLEAAANKQKAGLTENQVRYIAMCVNQRLVDRLNVLEPLLGKDNCEMLKIDLTSEIWAELVFEPKINAEELKSVLESAMHQTVRLALAK